MCLPTPYDTGGNMDRPALRMPPADIEVCHVDCEVVYMVDRLRRSLLDFAKQRVSFVSARRLLMPKPIARELNEMLREMVGRRGA
nr:hypothetical protein Hi04_10k_c2220_00033 [uncultured bacterium]